MTSENNPRKKALSLASLRWFERFLIATCGILLGAVGSAKFGASPLAVTVAIPREASLAQLPKAISPQPVSQYPRSVIGIAMFANGSSVPTKYAETNVRLWAQALAHCNDAELQLVGSTSSVPYRIGVSKNNIELAGARASAVASLFRSSGLNSVGINSLSHESELDAVRLVNDHPNKQLNVHLANVARRVDLYIQSFGSCEPLKP